MDRSFRIDMVGTYAYLGPSPVFSLMGKPNDDAVVNMYVHGDPEPTLFRDTSRLMPYLARTLSSHCSDIVTIVVPGLRYLYSNNLDLVSLDRHAHIGVAIKDPLPRFVSIFDIPALENSVVRNSAIEYQLDGVVNDLDVLHISVRDFVTAVNEKRPIRFLLPESDLLVELNYTVSDFWDEDYGMNIGYLDLARC